MTSPASSKSSIADLPLLVARSTRRALTKTQRAARLARTSASRLLARLRTPLLFDRACTVAIAPGRRPFVFLPWMPTHGDALLARVTNDALPLVPLPLFRSPERLRQRRRINRFVCDHPDLYVLVVRGVLRRLGPRIEGVVFTHDWPPAMRQAALVCRELGIPSLLIPHEAVFADRDRYYVDRITSADLPVCDRVFTWGRLQEEVFRERGYPPARLARVGSPKLDEALSYSPSLSRSAFCALYKFDQRRPIVLLALQPLDAQRDRVAAHDAQLRAIEDLRAVCRARGSSLLVRFPPSGHELVPAPHRAALAAAPDVALDTGPTHRASAREALFHCVCVCAVNSTMLLEGALMRRHALALRYLDFPELFAPAGIPSARDRLELAAALARLDHVAPGLTGDGLAWAADAFSAGVFDGRSVSRIRAALEETRDRPSSEGVIDPVAHLFGDSSRTVGSAICALHRVPPSSMAHLEVLLGFRRYLHAPQLAEAQIAEVFVKWGISATPDKRRQDRIARALERPQLIIEDGFLRSREIGLSGTPGLSVIVDTHTAYYDATTPSRLETRLNSASSLTPAQHDRAQRCIHEIRRARISKYNHAADSRVQYARGRSVLLVDQRFGDASVPGALACARSFETMLAWALDGPARSVLVKRHPDAISGGKRSYFSGESALLRDSRVVLIDEDVNPHTLFDQVEEVCVVASGMGFEALMADLPVRCFGAPFYAGWGLTMDMVQAPRRTRSRTLAEVFHAAYIDASRYYSGVHQRLAEIEDVIAELGADRAGKTS